MPSENEMKAAADVPKESFILRNIQAAGMVPMLNRAPGGTLHVFQTKPGVFSSAWRIGDEGERFIRKHKGRVAVVLVLDLNAQGHPVVMLALQPVNVDSPQQFAAKHSAGLAKQMKGRSRILRPK